jgi:hypothetical protein
MGGGNWRCVSGLTDADVALLHKRIEQHRIVVRAHAIHGRLTQSTDLPLHAIANQERVTPGYISRLLRLPLLAPDIVTAIVNGKNPCAFRKPHPLDSQ